ncbi:MAG TPA: glycosyltransferase family 4 protein [Pyrinomonadaceae bacterium]|nr:glycosyltransferase family 4 protein [Pyrinomonadaceae bacterium]
MTEREEKNRVVERGAESRAGAEASRAVARKTRVLMVAPSLGILGGQAVQAARLMERLRSEPDLEIDFLPVNPRLPGVLGKLQDVKYVRTLLTSAVYAASLMLRVRRYDVIHIFSASYFSFVLAPTPALLISRLYGKRAVLNYRSGEAEDHLARWRRTALPTMRLADRIIAPSGYLVDVFARFGLAASYIYNIVETERFRFRRRVPLKPVFFSNRNFEPLYNVACTLRAFALVEKKHTGARLILAGDGSQRAELEALARELSLKNVELLGRVEPARMHELYDAADIYLNSPDIDNMPGSIIEAFASGLAVVTTNAGGIPYIVTHNETGLMTERNDHEAMAKAALTLLEDSALAERIARAAYLECRKYSWDSVRGEWLALYKELAGAEAGSRRKTVSEPETLDREELSLKREGEAVGR